MRSIIEGFRGHRLRVNQTKIGATSHARTLQLPPHSFHLISEDSGGIGRMGGLVGGESGTDGRKLLLQVQQPVLDLLCCQTSRHVGLRRSRVSETWFLWLRNHALLPCKDGSRGGRECRGSRRLLWLFS